MAFDHVHSIGHEFPPWSRPQIQSREQLVMTINFTDVPATKVCIVSSNKVLPLVIGCIILGASRAAILNLWIVTPLGFA